MMTAIAAGSASTYLGGRLAPGKDAWKSAGKTLVELGTTLYAVGLHHASEPVPDEVALIAFRGLEHVHAYKRRDVEVDVSGFARAVKKSVENTDEAFTEAVRNMSPRLRGYTNALLQHDPSVIEGFSEDILETMDRFRSVSPTVAEALKVIDKYVTAENRGRRREESDSWTSWWPSWNPVKTVLEAVLGLLGWK
ncbi:hypothetical protein [Methanopyrus sp.]